MVIKVPALAIVSFFLFACHNKKLSDHYSKQNALGDISKNNRDQRLSKDTTISYSIEGISSEGSEVKAHYVNNSLKDASWKIYGETGQTSINYLFIGNGQIRCRDKEYTYKTDLTQVKSNADIYLTDSANYLLDTNGVVLSTFSGKGFVNSFMDFKGHVPFTIDY